MKQDASYWIVLACNAVIAVLAVLSIVFYFIFPFWRIEVNYTLESEQVDELLGDAVEIDTSEIIGDGISVAVGIEVEISDIFNAYSGNEDEVFETLIDGNVTKIVDQLSATLSDISKNVMQTVARTIVRKQVTDGVRDILHSTNPSVSDDEIHEKMSKIGVDDEYISSRTDAIIEKIYESGSTTADVSDEIVETVRDIYSRMSTSDDEDLNHMVFTEEDEAELRQEIDETIRDLAAEDGTIDPDELIANLLLQAMGSKKEGSGKAQTDVVLLSDEETSSTDTLKSEVKKMIMENIPEGTVRTILLWVLRGLGVLFLLSTLAWIYVLVKMIVKLIKRDPNPTVKLKCPIWLGWLPFLIFVAIPSLAFSLIHIPAISNMLPAEMLGIIQSTGIVFSSGGWFAAVAAAVCFAISIFYMVMRRQMR